MRAVTAIRDDEPCGFYWLERHQTTGAETYHCVVLDRQHGKPQAEQFVAASAEELKGMLSEAGWLPHGDVAALCESKVHLVGPRPDRRRKALSRALGTQGGEG